MNSPVFDDHFRNPRNTGVVEEADGRVEVENPVCGDHLVLTWALSLQGELETVRFQVYGCPAAIAAGSLVTELALDLSVDAFRALGADDIAQALGGLEESHFHAAVLAADVVKALGQKL